LAEKPAVVTVGSDTALMKAFPSGDPDATFELVMVPPWRETPVHVVHEYRHTVQLLAESKEMQ
jgi:hypothetical protein